MASSKLPGDFVLVSDQLREFASQHSHVLCNVRPWQHIPKRSTWWDKDFMDPGVLEFLHGSVKPGDRLLMHFQGYGDEVVGTMVFDLQCIPRFKDDDYPRLDFKHPPAMADINGCPNFWGAFILAIARAPNLEPMCEIDPGATHFMRLATEIVITEPAATPPPPERYNEKRSP